MPTYTRGDFRCHHQLVATELAIAIATEIIFNSRSGGGAKRGDCCHRWVRNLIQVSASHYCPETYYGIFNQFYIQGLLDDQRMQRWPTLPTVVLPTTLTWATIGRNFSTVFFIFVTLSWNTTDKYKWQILPTLVLPTTLTWATIGMLCNCGF